MKKILLGAALLLPVASFALSLNVHLGNVCYVVPEEKVGEMVFSSGNTLSVSGRDYNISEITLIDVDETSIDPNTISITYNGDNATVLVAGNIAQYIDATVDGANVSIIQSDQVSEATCGEITYLLQGESANGSLYAEGSYKSTYELRGLNLTNPAGAAIQIENGKRIAMSAKSGTENFLTDGEGGKQKGALHVKGHLELKGKGTLTVTGNNSHAIYAKEYVSIKNLTVNVTKAVKDGLNCNQYFLMESGSLNISDVGDDAVQVAYKDDADREEEDTGTATISGGTLNLSTSAPATKCLKADGKFIMTGGELTALVSGKGVWDSAKTKTKAAACVSADEGVEISGGTLNLTATGSGGKGVNTDSEMIMSDGELNISTTGGIFAYVNGVEYDNYTGNTDRLDSDAKSSPKGVKADGNITIDGGTINIITTGKGAEGIETKSELTINDGKVYVKAYDDAINSAADMYIKGGELTVISTNNDGLDSNHNIYLEGGYVRAFGARSPECGIDANDEEGYTVIFTGGTLIGAGGSNSVPSKSTSTQPYLGLTNSLRAGDTVTVKDGDEVLATFVVPDDYTASGTSGGGNRPGGSSGKSLVITCPGLTNGASYTVTYGSTNTTATAQTYSSSSNPGRPW